MEFLEWLSSKGGVCTVQQARNRISEGTLLSMRGTLLWTPLRGWVALVGVQNDVTRALRFGGVASCVTAFAAHGMWVPHGPQHIHVRANRETHSDRLAATATSAGVTLHRMHARIVDERPPFGIDGPLAALAAGSGCVSTVELVAAADSALALGIVERESTERLAQLLPRRRRRGLERATGRSGSGSESAFAASMRRAHVSFRQQAELWPDRFVDFLIGRCLVVEIDSIRWHASPEQQARDRARDADLTRRGYRVLRFTYEQVLFQPDYVVRTVLDIVQTGAHRRRPWA